MTETKSTPKDKQPPERDTAAAEEKKNGAGRAPSEDHASFEHVLRRLVIARDNL